MAAAHRSKSQIFVFAWNLRMITLQLLTFSLLFLGVHGGWVDPSFELLPNLPEGIKLVGERIFIPENVETGGGLSLLKLNVDDSDIVIRQSTYTSYYVSSETDGDDKTFWRLNVNETFDFEKLGGSEKVRSVVLNLDGQSSPKYLTVEIVDENDNSPEVVSQTPNPIDPIKELEEVEDPILTIVAKDEDVADNDDLQYEPYENGVISTNFEVRDNGKVFIKEPLDYAKRSIHRLNIKISDNRPPYFYTYANATVFVKDMPNRPPVFTKPPIINSVEDKIPIGTTIFTVEAQDGDYDLNFDVEYELKDDLGYFAIDKTSGDITVAKEIDADKDKVLIDLGLTYTFVVLAKEVNYDEIEYPDLPIEVTQAETPVTFAIKDINDHVPLICSQPSQEIDTCKGVENYAFEINETDLQVSLPNDLVIRVVDLDGTTAYSRYSAAIETDDDIIKQAFSISPERGIGEENFFILIKDTNAIDFENGQWHAPKKFKIAFTGDDNPDHIAVANFEVTVKDVNDNSPKFREDPYTFKVCENTPDGTELRNVQPNDHNYPNSCRDSEDKELIIVTADDDDLSDSFGKRSIRYKWSGREPPIQLNSETGGMIMQAGDGTGFDYERLTKEIFIVEAVDEKGTGRSTSVNVIFEILDRNDEPVDLRFSNGYRKTIEENNSSFNPVLEGITARDADETGNITWSMTVNEVFTSSRVLLENGKFASQYKKLDVKDDIKADVSKWFKLDPVKNEPRLKEFNLILGEELPDRDPPGQDDIDRVELTITVNDLNSETETENSTQRVSQIVTITIDDKNDNPPEWRDGEESNNFTGIITETEFEGEDDDTSSDRQREIYTLSVTDRDRNPTFFFSLSNEGDCELEDDICSNIIDMFELSNVESKSGVTILRRRKGKTIDRDNRDYFLDDNDILNINVVVSDEEKDDTNHQITAKFQIKVEDRNDHTPVFEKEYIETKYSVNEMANNVEVVVIETTDKDHPEKFGKVSYELIDGETSNGTDKFHIDLESGRITAKDGCCEWFEGNMYRLEVRAIDYYRPTSTSGSNVNTTFVHITIIDTNNNPPEFLTQGGNTTEDPLVNVVERAPVTSEALATILIQDKDNPELPNGNFNVDIEVTRDPATSEDLKDLFKLDLTKNGTNNIRVLKVSPTQNFTGLWGNYSIKFKATDGNEDVEGNTTEATYVFRVRNENLNRPEFIYPVENELPVLISITDSEPGKELVDARTKQPARAVEAEDKDKGSGENGEFVFSMQSDAVCEELFNLDAETGVISLKNELSEETHANKRCNLQITATDKGSPPQRTPAELVYILLNDRNTDPAFAQRLMPVHMLENCSASPSTLFDFAIDEDNENDNCFEFNPNFCEIYYFLKGGDSDMFNLETTEHGLQLKLKDGQEIDRETKDSYDVSIYATNDAEEEVERKTPQDVLNGESDQWAVIRIIVDDRLDTPPKFDGLSNGILTSGFTTRVQTDALIGEVKATDNDLNDRVTFRISSDFTITPGLPPVNPEIAPFELVKSGNLNTVDIKLNFDPQPNYKGHYTFQITAEDSVGETAKVQCQIYIVAEKNVVNFYFTSPTLDEMKIRQNDLKGILTNAFNYSCNVDRVFVNAAGSNGAITVETHFVNVENNEPVVSDYIQAQQFKPEFYRGLVGTLSDNGFALQRIGESDEIPESDVGQIVTFVLIGGVAVLTISLLILAATCFYNQKSLKLRVRALTANTFGSQQSDLNRLGMTNEAPNTNAFAVEGSNPVWTVDADRRKIPDFDTDSVGSGGSVLIGAEDEDYFQKSSKNPMFQGVDVLANYESDNDISDDRSYNKGAPDYAEDNNSIDSNNMNINDSPFTSKTSRNPLMNFGEAQQSIDVDEDFGDEPFQFEANTDGGLF